MPLHRGQARKHKAAVMAKGQAAGICAGFTLIEVVCAVCLIVMLWGLAARACKGLSDAWDQRMNHIYAAAVAQQILDCMASEIMYATCISGNPHDSIKISSFVGYDGNFSDPDNLFIKNQVKPGSDMIFFIAPAYYPYAQVHNKRYAGSVELCEIGYWLRDDNQLMRMIIERKPAFDYDLHTPDNFSSLSYSTPCGVPISDLQFQYYYLCDAEGSVNCTELGEWDAVCKEIAFPGQHQGIPVFDIYGKQKQSLCLPLAVRVTITMLADTIPHSACAVTQSYTRLIRIPEQK